jgi:hypothetical protein
MEALRCINMKTGSAEFPTFEAVLMLQKMSRGPQDSTVEAYRVSHWKMNRVPTLKPLNMNRVL